MIKSGIFFIVLIFLIPLQGFSQEKLDQADSLFAAQKYTEAFDVYDEIFENGDASPSMLLKMAFIKEGLEEYVEALYFLNLYYIQSGNKKALVKMQEIATANHLEGYQYTDQDFMINILNKNRLYIETGMIILIVFLLIYAIRKFQKKQSASLPLFFQILLMALLFVFSNEFFTSEKAIVMADHTLLRSAPSAAAETLDSINKGHKVRVLDQSEIWVKIEWNDQPAYLRKGRIRVL